MTAYDPAAASDPAVTSGAGAPEDKIKAVLDYLKGEFPGDRPNHLPKGDQMADLFEVLDRGAVRRLLIRRRFFDRWTDARALIKALRDHGAEQSRGILTGFGVMSLMAVLAVLALTCVIVSIKIAKHLAMRQARPILANLQRELFASAEHVIVHDGFSADQLAPGVTVTHEQKQNQTKTARRQLNQVGTLFEVARRSTETDLQYAQRLGAYLANFPVMSLED